MNESNLKCNMNFPPLLAEFSTSAYIGGPVISITLNSRPSTDRGVKQMCKGFQRILRRGIISSPARRYGFGIAAIGSREKLFDLWVKCQRRPLRSELLGKRDQCKACEVTPIKSVANTASDHDIGTIR
jgi:hypothetical protein